MASILEVESRAAGRLSVAVVLLCLACGEPPQITETGLEDMERTAPSEPNAGVSIQTDAMAPIVLMPINGWVTNNNRPDYRGSAEAGSVVTVIVDGTAVGRTTADVSGTWSLLQSVALMDGSHAVKAWAPDERGTRIAESPDSVFRVDVIPPAPPNVLSPAHGSSLTHTQPTYMGTAEVGSLVTIWLNKTVVGTIRAPETGHWRFTPTARLPEGLPMVAFTARDEAGNISHPTICAYRVDSAPPEPPDGESHYGWSCATTPSLPAIWALLAVVPSPWRRRAQPHPQRLRGS